MKMIGRRTKAQQTWWITMLLSTGFLWSAVAGDTTTPGGSCQSHEAAPLRIVDQYGRPVPTEKRAVGGNVFDVTVGPKGNELSFVPDSVNIVVGDTVRWTWASDSHSVTSGTSCIEDDQFCSPNNMNCETGILNNTGFVYEFTFTQPGMYQYFCDLHCFAGMTGVVNVRTTHPTPRPRPTPAPRP
jgi:plastocyanin